MGQLVVKKFRQCREATCLYWLGQGKPQGKLQPLSRRVSALGKDTMRERLGELDERLVIERYKLL